MILIVEDDPILQFTLEGLLKHQGYSIRTTGSMAEAMGEIQQRIPAILIVDLGLPDGSGLELLDLIAHYGDDAPLAIVSTADSSSESAIEALRRGAFDFLIKPINPEWLYAAVNRAKSHHDLRRFKQNVRLFQAQKEAMRATARAAAHHISQHLTVVLAELQLMHEDVSDPELRVSIERAIHSTEAAAEVIEDLRNARSFVVRDNNALGAMLDLDAASPTAGNDEYHP